MGTVSGSGTRRTVSRLDIRVYHVLNWKAGLYLCLSMSRSLARSPPCIRISAPELLLMPESSSTGRRAGEEEARSPWLSELVELETQSGGGCRLQLAGNGASGCIYGTKRVGRRAATATTAGRSEAPRRPSEWPMTRAPPPGARRDKVGDRARHIHARSRREGPHMGGLIQSVSGAIGRMDRALTGREASPPWARGVDVPRLRGPDSLGLDQSRTAPGTLTHAHIHNAFSCLTPISPLDWWSALEPSPVAFHQRATKRRRQPSWNASQSLYAPTSSPVLIRSTDTLP